MLNIIQKPSPNFGSRGTYKPEIFCLHIMAGTLAGTDSWFATPVSQVSSHFGVGCKGQVHQYVPVQQTAWANGRVSNPTFKLYKKDINPNLYTISIENEGQDLSKAPVEQLKAICELLQRLSKEYGIPLDRDHIIGHYQVFDKKPFCPATDNKIIDKIVAMTQDTSETPKSIILKRLVELQKLVEEL